MIDPVEGYHFDQLRPDAANAIRDGLKACTPFSKRQVRPRLARCVRRDARWRPESGHWYRQDSDGYWSHKPGDTPVIGVVTDPWTGQLTDPIFGDRISDPHMDACPD